MRAGFHWSVIVGCILGSSVLAQPSPFNGRVVPPVDSSGHYRLVFSGHFHGASDNASGYPAATLLAGLELINGLGAHALVSTGDLFLNPDRDSARYRQAFFDRLHLPLFNAPGNHDKEGRAFGSVAYPQRVELGKDVLLLLDTERDNSDITGDQLIALERLTGEVEAGLHRRVFIVSHRPVWAEDDAVYGPLFSGNTRSLTGCNYRRDVWPLLNRMATRSQVFWVSGSMAGGAPASVFFQPHAPNITFIQTAIRNELRDAVLVMDAWPDSLRWDLVSLTGQRTAPVESHDAAWWAAHRRSGAKPFQWRLLPYLVRTTVTHRAFPWGVLAGALLCWLVRFSFRRWW